MGEPVSIALLPYRMHEFAHGIAEWKDFHLLAVNERTTEFCLDTFVFGDERFVERLFDENGSEFTVSHRTILTILWIPVPSM